MSDTLQLDPILLDQPMPSGGDLVPHEQFGSIEIITCCGRFESVSFDQPRAVQSNTPNRKPSPPTFNVRFLMAPFNNRGEPLCQQLLNGCYSVANAAWPNGFPIGDPATGATQVISAAEAIQYKKIEFPVHDGNELWKVDPVGKTIFRGMYYLSAKAYPTDFNGAPKEPPFYDDGRGKRLTDPGEIGRLFRAGNYGQLSLRIRAHTHESGTLRIKFDLLGARFWCPGEPLGYAARTNARVAQSFKASTLPPSRFAQQQSPGLPGGVPGGMPPAGPATVQGWAAPEQGSNFRPEAPPMVYAGPPPGMTAPAQMQPPQPPQYTAPPTPGLPAHLQPQPGAYPAPAGWQQQQPASPPAPGTAPWQPPAGLPVGVPPNTSPQGFPR